MRAHELLDRPVVGPQGQPLGRVLDVRLVQDGPLLGAFAALRVEGLVVGTRTLASRLGYDRYDAQGPWLVARAVSWLTRGTRYLPWESLTLSEDVVESALAELPPLPRLTG